MFFRIKTKAVKNRIRPYRDFFSSIYGYIYDLVRYLHYSGYRGYVSDDGKRDYKAVKIYHRLEKSLSFRERRSGAAWQAAEELIDLLSGKPEKNRIGFHEGVAINVLNEYAKISDGVNFPRNFNFCEIFSGKDIGGILTRTSNELTQGVLSEPEKFFYSRHSIRDYADKRVSLDLIKRAVYLALKTPSVCNRQAWYVYYTDVRVKIDACLSLQNGNSGFGHEIPSLMIIAADLKAFDAAGERNQAWIDGGMFSMSIVYALHSLGLSSCCLNWSKTPRDDRRIRGILPVKEHHNIIMMISIGYPRDEIKVCASARKPLNSFFEYWK